MQLSVVVVGSVQNDRAYQPPLHNIDLARSACRQLGRELALAGFDLVVFSSDSAYIELDVAEGYLAEFPGAGRQPGKITVRSPRSMVGLSPWPRSAHVRISYETDTTDEWEVSYYRSVLQADGVLLVGGGRSTRIAGVIAMSQRIPVVPVATFGGGAALVWENLSKVHNDATADDLAVMGRPWDDDAARLLVGSLRDQHRRRMAHLREQDKVAGRAVRVRTVSSLIGMAALVLAAFGVVVASPDRPTSVVLSVVLVAPMLAAVGGAMLRDTFGAEPHALWSAARGLGAGLVSSMLYVGSQLLTTPDLLDHLNARRLLWFTIPLGFAAGTAFDLVYERLRSLRLLGVAGLGAPAATTPHTTPGRRAEAFGD